MLKKFERLLIGIALVLALFIAKELYEEYQSRQYYRRVMELLRQPEPPNVVIDPDGTIRGDGFVIRP